MMARLIDMLILFLAGGGCGAVLVGPRLAWWSSGQLARSRQDCQDCQDCPGPAGCRLVREEDTYDGS